MKTIMVRFIKFVLVGALVSSCAAMEGPSKDSGLARFKLQWLTGSLSRSELRGSIISILDSKGNEIYNIKDRSALTYTIDVPKGDYRVITTCAPASYRYEKHKNQYNYKLSEYNVSTQSGDYVRLDPLRSRGSYQCVAKPFVSSQRS